jgi:hypothetical protein
MLAQQNQKMSLRNRGGVRLLGSNAPKLKQTFSALFRYDAGTLPIPARAFLKDQDCLRICEKITKCRVAAGFSAGQGVRAAAIPAAVLPMLCIALQAASELSPSVGCPPRATQACLTRNPVGAALSNFSQILSGLPLSCWAVVA